ncbi:hypothetical protein [Streptomyces sp. NPDC002537]
MSRPAESHDHPVRSIDHGLRQLDGYLYWQAELATARQEATAFCDHLPWLTTSERQELEDHYTRARTKTAEATTRRIADRCIELRQEYEARYRQLRRRTVTTSAIVTSGLCATLTMVLCR